MDGVDSRGRQAVLVVHVPIEAVGVWDNRLMNQSQMIPPLQPDQPLLEWLDDIRQAANRGAIAEGGSGISVSQSADGRVISMDKTSGLDSSSIISQLRVFRINSSTPIPGTGDASESDDDNGNPTQWTYSVSLVRKAKAGYSMKGTNDREAWVVSGSFDGTGYNFLEDSNTGVGQLQNGVNHDNSSGYPANWKMQPLQKGSIHPGMVIEVGVEPDTPPREGESSVKVVRECWLMPYSGEDGTCFGS